MVIALCGLAGAGCGRQTEPTSTGIPVTSNTVLPWLMENESAGANTLRQMTTEVDMIIHAPTPIDEQETERKRIRQMALIDDRKKEDQAGQQSAPPLPPAPQVGPPEGARQRWGMK